MYLSTISGVSFQTAWAFAVILAASFLATPVDVAIDCEQQSKTELKTIYLSFIWSLLGPHPLKPVKETSKNVRVKIDLAGSHINVHWTCPICECTRATVGPKETVYLEM